MTATTYELIEGIGPLVATAIHNGHGVRAEVAAELAIGDADRLREEDPYTGIWTDVAPTRIIGATSRFEMDLNRPSERSIYIRPEDAWGLTVWKREPSADLVSRSQKQYHDFYTMAETVLSRLEEQHGRFVVLDLHTYNHRRDGCDGSPADPEANPEVNVGTGTMNRMLWGPVIERFMSDLGRFDVGGRRLDVRENIRFKGGHFARWIHERFPESGCALAIEVKKFFMDEWSGERDPALFVAVHRALRSAVPGLSQTLKAMPVRR